MYLNLLNLHSVFLMMPSGGKSGTGGGGMLFFIAAMLVVMWLFMIRPQSKKAKNQKQFNQNIQKGDRIVTIAGIHGRISKINDDDTLQLEVSPGSYMTIERSAISMEFTQGLEKRKEAMASADKK
ncbi:MAG: preprotein translocase subunit YajC [Chitinophagaceae bacterium]|nr:MAG: preprotein translocase subunit YajC [Chitinophagaceae bacterium]